MCLFCRDNSKLCSCGGDRQVFYWDVTTGRVIRKFRGHDSEVCIFAFTKDFPIALFFLNSSFCIGVCGNL